jgi:hypothetical protein
MQAGIFMTAVAIIGKVPPRDIESVMAPDSGLFSVAGYFLAKSNR